MSNNNNIFEKMTEEERTLAWMYMILNKDKIMAKQEPILDRIRAEIEEIETYDGLYIDRAYVLEIIDKYRKERE